MQCRRIRSVGFTLIELLVVVSIIALLISILLPAVGETRRQARISMCTSNMKQHGIGVSSYASQNNDTLPHAPVSRARTPADVAFFGPAGQIVTTFASERAPLNGFAFQDPGVSSFFSPNNQERVLNNSQFFQNLQGWNGYFIFLSEYMVDGEGVQALNDVFLSPSDTAAKVNSWPRIRRIMRENLNGRWWALNRSTDAPMNNPACGSYRYVAAAMSSYRIYSVNQLGEPLAPDYIITNREAGGGPVMSPALRAKYVQRNPVAAMDYPSNKALFWMWYAWHNPNLILWCEDNAITSVTMGDGSSRSIRPFQDALPLLDVTDPRRYENAGPILPITYIPTDSTWPGHFYLTNGGIRGRDL